MKTLKLRNDKGIEIVGDVFKAFDIVEADQNLISRSSVLYAKAIVITTTVVSKRDQILRQKIPCAIILIQDIIRFTKTKYIDGSKEINPFQKCFVMLRQDHSKLFLDMPNFVSGASDVFRLIFCTWVFKQEDIQE